MNLRADRFEDDLETLEARHTSLFKRRWTLPSNLCADAA